MKNERLLEKLNLIDDKYINEVKLGKKKRNTVNWFIRVGALAACFCLMMITGLNLFLFMPFKTTVPDVSQYESSEYFPIIEKLNMLNAKEPKYKNNFDKISSTIASIGGVFDKDGVAGDASDNTAADSDFAPGDSGDEEYNEITDNQVEGVTEGDIIKRSDKYIYYLSGGILMVYSIEGAGSKKVGEIDLSRVEITNENGKPEEIDLFSYNSEMYLSKDCKTVTIIGMDAKKTRVVALDVSNPESITLKSYASIEGNYQTSRMVNGKLLVVTSKYYKNIDFSNAETFVPSVSYNNETETMLVPMENIACADKITSKHYTVVSLLDENTLDLDGCASFLSFTNDVYITDSAIYASNSLYEDFRDVSLRSKQATEISCISYGDDGFDVKGSIKIDGHIKDRYSLDEYEGILRVVTTTRVSTVQYNAFYDEDYSKPTQPNGTNASLYCIDLESWKIVASVEKFAPIGESVRSVRFDKNYAYVCTAVEIQDPVFFFDLSDLNNITYTQTDEIAGFSTSLINLGNGYLLGIGIEDWSDVKVEVYREENGKVVSVDSYVIEDAGYDTNYKSYYVNREMGMFGFGYYGYGHKTSTRYEGCRYVLLMFANGELLEVVNVPINASPNDMRSVYIDGYLYVFGADDFKVVKV